MATDHLVYGTLKALGINAALDDGVAANVVERNVTAHGLIEPDITLGGGEWISVGHGKGLVHAVTP
ncbi:hypothetical protein PSCICN_09380 [Pseudomonas cichorii]|nr:hypothetical protein PSCICN_09380 [Pseudomonas cichorii]